MSNVEQAMRKLAVVVTEKTEASVPEKLEDIIIFMAENYHGGAGNARSFALGSGVVQASVYEGQNKDAAKTAAMPKKGGAK